MASPGDGSANFGSPIFAGERLWLRCRLHEATINPENSNFDFTGRGTPLPDGDANLFHPSLLDPRPKGIVPLSATALGFKKSIKGELRYFPLEDFRNAIAMALDYK